MAKRPDEVDLEAATAALLALTEHGIPEDIQSLLIQGSKNAGIPPGALSKAIQAALVVYRVGTHEDEAEGPADGSAA
jgi:hypothetical protein